MKSAPFVVALIITVLSAPANCLLNAVDAQYVLRTGIEVPPPPAAAPQAALTPRNAKNQLPGRLPENPLIVVHASRSFDASESARAGIDSVIAEFTSNRRPVIYLLDDQSLQGYHDWYPQNRTPDYEIFSAGGEHNLPLAADEVTVIGGFFGSYDGARGCHTLAVRDAIRMHFEASDAPFTVNMPLNAIYFYDEDRAVRAELLALDPATAPPASIRKLFNRFPESFFLVDNFQTSAADAPEFGHPFIFPEDNPAYRAGGPVDTARYSFELKLNGASVSKFGSGRRLVILKLQNETSGWGARAVRDLETVRQQ